jgi:hypothetical protein
VRFQLRQSKRDDDGVILSAKVSSWTALSNLGDRRRVGDDRAEDGEQLYRIRCMGQRNDPAANARYALPTRLLVDPFGRLVAAVASHLALDLVDTEPREDMEGPLELGIFCNLRSLQSIFSSRPRE